RRRVLATTWRADTSRRRDRRHCRQYVHAVFDRSLRTALTGLARVLRPGDTLLFLANSLAPDNRVRRWRRWWESDLLGEMCAGDIAGRRATCAHQITFIVNAAYGRRRSRRRRHTSWRLVPWTSRESNRSALGWQRPRSRPAREA